jgi:hypothetical protein
MIQAAGCHVIMDCEWGSFLGGAGVLLFLRFGCNLGEA